MEPHPPRRPTRPPRDRGGRDMGLVHPAFSGRNFGRQATIEKEWRGQERGDSSLDAATRARNMGHAAGGATHGRRQRQFEDRMASFEQQV